jgi:hypothetical protein
VASYTSEVLLADGAVSVESVDESDGARPPPLWGQFGSSAGGVAVDGSAGAVAAGGSVVVGSVWALARDIPPAPSSPTTNAAAASFAGWSFMLVHLLVVLVSCSQQDGGESRL